MTEWDKAYLMGRDAAKSGKPLDPPYQTVRLREAYVVGYAAGYADGEDHPSAAGDTP